jgi:integrase
MKVTLRQRAKEKKIVLFLDYYQNRIRKTEYLDLYLIPEPKTGKLSRLEKIHNEESLNLAKSICLKRQLEIQSGKFDITDIKKQKAPFLPFMEKLAEVRNTSKGNEGNWFSMLKHYKDFAHKGLSFDDITPKFVLEFKSYLETVRTSSGKLLANNTRISYYNKFKATLNEAKKLGLISKNPSDNISGFKYEEVRREFLTEEELIKLSNTECRFPILKQAFLFSALTGLRWSDIVKLTWGEIFQNDSLGNYLRFRQAKTKGSETLAISNSAFNLLGDRKGNDEKVFKSLKYSSHLNEELKLWVLKAGINKNVTFHIARHTNAVLLLSKGIDIFTVSKMLGHKQIATTMLYSNIMDEKKKEAASRLNFKF